MKNINWKTTAAGIGSILTGVGSFMVAYFDSDPLTEPNWTAVMAAIVAGLGLIFAKDGANKA